MEKYQKINTIFKRDNRGKIIEGIYSTPEIEFLKDLAWIWTEKVDGTNIRIGFKDGVKEIGGREENSQISTFLYKKLEELFPVEILQNVFPDSSEQIILFGEGYGNKINKVGKQYNPNGVDFILFDVKIGSWWLKRDDVEDVAYKLNLLVVPIISIEPLSWAINHIKHQLLPSRWTGVQQIEGLVGTPKVQLFNRKGERIITKIKTKDFK